jgi:hypothetical protein
MFQAAAMGFVVSAGVGGKASDGTGAGVRHKHFGGGDGRSLCVCDGSRDAATGILGESGEGEGKAKYGKSEAAHGTS